MSDAKAFVDSFNCGCHYLRIAKGDVEVSVIVKECCASNAEEDRDNTIQMDAVSTETLDKVLELVEAARKHT